VDFSCPLELKKIGANADGSTPKGWTVGDCTMREAGTAYPGDACAAGYHCLDYTKDAKAFATPAGTFSASASSTGIASASACGAAA
jgi:hypothetical protein